MQPFELCEAIPPTKEQIAAIAKASGQSETVVRAIYAEIMMMPIVRNDKYQVVIRETEAAPMFCLDGIRRGLIHLSIKRIDKQPIHDWRDLQEIKNALVGKECEGVELYPAESRLTDSANQYHLWVIVDPDFRFPFGFDERFVLDDVDDGAGAAQRSRMESGQ